MSISWYPKPQAGEKEWAAFLFELTRGGVTIAYDPGTPDDLVTRIAGGLTAGFELVLGDGTRLVAIVGQSDKGWRQQRVSIECEVLGKQRADELADLIGVAGQATGLLDVVRRPHEVEFPDEDELD